MDIVFKAFVCILIVLIINVLSNICDNLGVIAWLLGGKNEDDE